VSSALEGEDACRLTVAGRELGALLEGVEDAVGLRADLGDDQRVRHGDDGAIIPVMAGDLWTVNLGVIEYREAWALQERVRCARQADAIPDTLLLLEHPPVYTRGRRSQPGELGFGEDWYRAQGIDIVDVDRGGLLTYHSPGQLVGYPIMRVGDLMAYIGTMERAIVAALADQGVADARGRSSEGREVIGAWVAQRKIASIGVHRSREVTTHGFAVNVDNDLAPFGWVVACGLPDVHMTSVAHELGADGHLPCFRKRMAYRFAEAFGRRQRLVSAARLETAIAAAPVLA
jgi:lipoyl(octanoyl) transferase